MKLLSDPYCRQEILARLERVRPDTPRRWGTMSASQMVCHLNDCFLGVMGDRPMQIPRGFTMMRLMKNFALYAPVQWPQGVPTRPEFDQQGGGGTPPAQFESDMRGLLASIEKFTAEPRGFSFRPHPMFKAMSDKDWMRWGYLHSDHHLRQFGQ
jgi:hypothetical protein